jgi:tripartite ATP-independent transporter DctM subunit
MLLAIFLGLLIIFFLAGVGVPYAIGGTSIIGMILQSGIENINYAVIAQKMVGGVNNFTLLAIPFFLLAGKLMNVGTITKRIFKFANYIVGWIPGGLAHANILASIVFAGMSGSAVADAAGLGTIEIEAMQEAGFDMEFSAGITAASSTIGPIIPPSVPLIVFGVAGGVSIVKLLVAGVLPGLLMGTSLMIIVYVYSVKRGYPKTAFPGWKSFLKSGCEAFLPLMTPVILIGGILGGIFTPTEAASVASLYAFMLTFFIYREMKMKDLVTIFREVIVETSVILFIVAASSLYGYLLVKARIPMIIMNNIMEVTKNPYLVLIILNFF